MEHFKIFKYELPEVNNKINLPKGSRVMTIQPQNGKICMWVMVNLSEDVVERRFDVFETGDGLIIGEPLNREYIATVQISNVVYHIFELKVDI